MASQRRVANHTESSMRFLGQFSYRVNAQSQIVRESEPHTVIPERPRLEIVTYVVQAGDTTESIAEQFGLQPTTIMWSNPALEKAPDLLKTGQTLVILPIDGVYHTVEEGDTLEELAEDYKVSVEEIVECPFNDIPYDQVLDAGDKVIVPGGTKPYEHREVTTYTGVVPEDTAGTGNFSWPAAGHISQGYWYGHRAIDIANAIGTAITASDAGYVSFAGWTDIGYGYLVVIDHANGYQTYYAHLSDIYVVEGQSVALGKVIGAMGSTGNSTGPHLHFEVRYNQYPTNPLVYLP
jgi:murein DD-endopeptidase MepM/ murein hydrolase activator NlpD